MADQAEWIRRWQPTLSSQPWKILRIDDTLYLFKTHFGESSYAICLCDFQTIYHEKVENQNVTRRCKSLNPKFEAPLSRLLSHLSQNIQSEEKQCQWSLQKQTDEDGEVVLATIKTQLSGLPFVWEFHLRKAAEKELQYQLLFPLLAMVGELGRRQSELKRLLEAKDCEIQDYKTSGARVSRRTLETLQFDAKAFTNEMNLSQKFEQVVRNCQSRAFELPECRELYKQVMAKDAFLNRRIDTADSAAVDEDSLFGLVSSLEESGQPVKMPDGTRDRTSTGSWSNRMPSSLVPESMSDGSKRRSTSKSPDISPNIASLAPSSAEIEMQTRAALAKRLESEAEKEKSKKKKKKLL
ncbi:non-homologous end-joining factor 1-like [Corticium candelabrum]|uniref:non-homologous end-joining factor 1-like n=1 Tax=Corticium candelabrum TaxID=121492 RepID=UPI002E27098A|nr:non-homologous end-joining factor 1-like [Corticium candelabrum]